MRLGYDTRTYLLGKQYEARKKRVGGRSDRDFSGGQNDHPKTAELIGKQYSARKKREPFKGNQYTNGGGQNDPQQNTADLIGKQYEARKKRHGGQIPGSRIGQNDPSITAEHREEPYQARLNR
jgi:hypothetical protein